MSGRDRKTYIVWAGRQPGIYDSWDACRAQVIGVKGAKYKGFAGITREESQQILAAGPETYLPAGGVRRSASKGKSSAEREERREAVRATISPDAIAVDASSRGNPGAMEYRGVYVETGDEVFHSRVYPVGTNNIGEFLAIVHALAWEEQMGYFPPIYSDSRNAIQWVRQKRCKTTLPRSARTEELYRHIDRALLWLERHDLSRFDLRKWPTEELGEIPADFGRK